VAYFDSAEQVPDFDLFGREVRRLAVDYKGVQYKIMKTTTPIDPPKSVPVQGNANGLTAATQAAKRAIKNWLKANAAPSER
jgi:hypothetical protein